MKKVLWMAAVGGPVLLFGALVAIGLAVGPDRIHAQAEAIRADEAATETALVKEQPKVSETSEWRTVRSWSGSGIKETETFAVTSREWRVNWRSANEPFPNAGILQIFVNDEDGNMVTFLANKQGPGSDVSYVRGKGRFYLHINSANVDWNVTVEARQ